MQNRNRKMMLALLMLTMSVSLAWADGANLPASGVVEQDTVATVNPEPIDYDAIAAVMVQKLHADATLNTEQQAEIAALTVEYFQERQAVLDVPKRDPLSEEVIMLLQQMENRYQAEVNRLLSSEQRETVNVKREERKAEVLREAQVMAKEAAAGREQTNKETSN